MYFNWLDYRFENNPNDIFIRYDANEFSYENFNNMLYDRIMGLSSLGLRPRQKVGIYLSNPFDFIEAYLACYSLNAISVIFNDGWKKNEIKSAVDITCPEYIVCSWKDRGLFTDYKASIISFEELSKSHGSCYDSRSKMVYNPNDVQSILFTSGTQGTPKAVCLTFKNFYESSMKWKSILKLKNTDRYHLCLPLYHIGGLGIILRALHIGFSINIDLDKNFNKTNDSSIISLVPTLLMSLMDNEVGLGFLKRLRCIVVSGSKVSKKLMEDCRSLGLKVFVSYGMTETCSSICGFWPFNNKENILSVGRPFIGVDIDIDNNQIVVKSDTVMKRYYGHNNVDGVFKTKDLGLMIDGYLYLKGRSDGVVISGGENIDQKEIINAISTLGQFEKIIPFCDKDSYWGQINGVYVFTKDDISSDNLKIELKKILSSKKIPQRIIVKKVTPN